MPEYTIFVLFLQMGNNETHFELRRRSMFYIKT